MNLYRICGIHHLERPNRQPWDLFESTWFIVVTFSTVGYGDYKPEDWPAQTFVMIMIACALILLPVEVSLLFIFTVDSNVSCDYLPFKQIYFCVKSLGRHCSYFYGAFP